MYSRHNLSKIKDGTNVINLDEVAWITHWIVLYVNGDKIIYFDSFGLELFPKENKKSKEKKI